MEPFVIDPVVNDPIATFSAMTAADWGWVALATVVIFAILGPRMFRDVRGWLS